jgi:hypothetical protein
MDAQLIDQNLGGGTSVVLASHRRLREMIERSRFAAPGIINFDCRDRRR